MDPDLPCLSPRTLAVSSFLFKKTWVHDLYEEGIEPNPGLCGSLF